MECLAGFAAPIGMRLIILLLGLSAVVATAEPIKFSSGLNRVHLLELYSSEGCSSCPPAEQWLSELRSSPGLWRDFVPGGFHVDYWDRLGWRDRFASKANTVRQYAYSSQWRSDTVYTPEFVLDDAEWRKSSGQNLPVLSAERAVELAVAYTDDGTCRVTFPATGKFDVYVALLGNEISSDVRAGENQGRILRHDFVVLKQKTGVLEHGSVELTLTQTAGDGISRHALAVWVSRSGELAPIQATGGWLN
jgi:hypothetical protein